MIKECGHDLVINNKLSVKDRLALVGMVTLKVWTICCIKFIRDTINSTSILINRMLVLLSHKLS